MEYCNTFAINHKIMGFKDGDLTVVSRIQCQS
jgi:hypothetical protein